MYFLTRSDRETHESFIKMIEFEGKMCSAAEKEQKVGKNNRATKVW